jgi:hypothetical protein
MGHPRHGVELKSLTKDNLTLQILGIISGPFDTSAFHTMAARYAHAGR